MIQGLKYPIYISFLIERVENNGFAVQIAAFLQMRME